MSEHGSARPRPGPLAAARASFGASLPSWALVGTAVWATVVVGAWIALAELDALVAQVVRDGRTSSVTALTGPGTLGTDASAALAQWQLLAQTLEETAGAPGWVLSYALVDLVLVVAYVGGPAVLLVRRALASSAGRAWFVTSVVALLLAGAADVVESLLLLALADGADPSARLVEASRGKWAGIALAAAAALVGARQAGDHPRGAQGASPYDAHDLAAPPGPVGRALRGLYTHRFSLLVVVPFAALGLAKGSDVLDQLPDVQRQWVDQGPGWRLLLAGLLTAGVAAVVVVVGRLRSHHVAMRVLPAAAPYRHPSLLPWFVTAVVVAAGAGVSWVLLSGWEVIAQRFWVAVAVPFAVWALSGVWRAGETSVLWSPYRRPLTPAQAATTRTVGDVLGALVLVVPGLGLVRAFTAPVALGERGWNVAFLVVGVLGAVLAWPATRLAGSLLARLGRPATLTALTPGEVLAAGSGNRARLGGWVLLAAGVLLFVVLGLHPRAVAEHLGVIEVVLLAVTAVALPLGATVILLQGGGAPDLLSRPGTPVLRTAPVMTLIVLTALVVGLTGGDAHVHGVRVVDGRSADPGSRETLEERVRALAVQEGCATALPGTALRVRPVFLLAAEGGGIRAAAWTALGTDALHEAGGDCAGALMSSGASGGAVGLTVSGFVEDEGAAFAAVRSMAGPDTLGVAVTGLLVRDPLRSVTGVPFPTAGEPGWVDRAGLMEREWEEEVGALATPFLDGDRSRVTGALVLSSTSVATRCRTLLSQVRLDTAPDPRSCTTATAPPDAVDLLATLRTGCTGAVPALRASTVALLASRFPYLTPSGVVTTGCLEGSTDPDTQQVVDGGYADNDGLGTVLDLAPQWLPALRAHNEEVVAGRGGGVLLVPVLVYLDNGSGSDLGRKDAGSTNEVLVPLLTKGAATGAMSSTDTQLHRVQDVLSTAAVVPGCAGVRSLPSPARPTVCAAVDAWRGSVAKVFYQPTRPSISAPLGWVLSEQSLQSLRCARDEQVAGAGLAPVAGGRCRPEAALAPAPELRAPGPGDACADRAGRDRSPLAGKGYGTMLAALCLARQAAAGG